MEAACVPLGVEANGDIKGCSAMASQGYVGGNVRDKSIREIWDTAPELHITRKFAIDDLWGYCRSCYYAETCKGGCVWTSSTLLGKTGNNPYCHHRALEMLRGNQRERLTLVSKASRGDPRHRAFRADRRRRSGRLVSGAPRAGLSPSRSRNRSGLRPPQPIP